MEGTVRTHKNYEVDDVTFPADAYLVDEWGEGISFYVLGWETEPDEDTEWSGFEIRTGNVVVRMVGDDRNFSVELDSLTPLARKDYCGVCGQIGCTHDGLDREATP